MSPLEVAKGLSEAPLTLQHVPQVAMGLGVVRVELNGLLVGVDSLIQLPLIAQGSTEIVVGSGVVRVEFNGLFVRVYGLIHLTLNSQGVAAIVVGAFCVVLLLEIRGRLLVVFLALLLL